jgi:hypothetical protein
MSNEWAGVMHANMPKYVKGLENLVMRDRILLAMLKKNGRIEYNKSSHECIWHVKFSQPEVEPYEDGSVIDFQRHDPARKCSLDWRGYVAQDVMTKKERLMNKSDVAIYKRYDTIATNLREAMTDTFGNEIYIDGNAAGNESRMHGIESFMGYTTTTSASKLAAPDDNYAGRNTDLQDQGGSWSSTLATPPVSGGTDWPNGSGSSEYDFYSPKLVNTAFDWGAGSAGWANQADLIIRRVVSYLRLTGGKQGRPDLLLTNGEWLAQYKDLQASKQRIIVPHSTADDLGFDDSVRQEGLVLYDDFECPEETAYVFNINRMKLQTLHDSLFYSEGPDYLLDNLSWRWVVGYFGNLQFQPKYFAKIADFT